MDNSSKNDDPLLINPENGSPEISIDSPSIDVGENLNSDIIGNSDFNGNPRLVNIKPDLGAFEFQETTSLDKTLNIQGKIRLYQNYPNPFNPSTLISYRLNSLSTISVDIFNNRGQWIESLIRDEPQTAGFYNLLWQAEHQSSGIYYAVLKSSMNNLQTIKMLLIH